MPAAAFLDLFLQKAGLVKERRWDARLDKTASCSWDSPPVRVVAYKNRIIYLRVKPSLNATVDHFVRLLIPDGVGCTAETAYKQLKALVKPFHRFVRVHGSRKKEAAPVGGAASVLSQFHQKAQELADAPAFGNESAKVSRPSRRDEVLDDEYREITQQLATISEASIRLSRLSDIQNMTPIKT